MKVKVIQGDAWYIDQVGEVFEVEDQTVQYPANQNDIEVMKKQAELGRRIYLSHYQVKSDGILRKLIDCSHAEVVDE